MKIIKSISGVLSSIPFNTIVILMLIPLFLAYSGKYEWRITDYGYDRYDVAYKSIRCIESKYCFAAGNKALTHPLIKFSNNGGLSWITSLDDPPRSGYDSLGKFFIYNPPKLEDASFPSKDLYIAVCDSTYYWRTTDLGKNWIYSKYDTSYHVSLYLSTNISMYDSKYGSISNIGRFYITEDGGNTFNRIIPDLPDSIIEPMFSDISMPDSNTIILLAYTKEYKDFIMRSDDGGINWTVYGTINPRVRQIHFLDKLHGWAIGKSSIDRYNFRNIVQETFDGGKTWIKKLDILTKEVWGFSKINFLDSFHGIILGDPYKFWWTNDGGQNWQQDSSYNIFIGEDFFYDITYVNTNTIIGVHEQVGYILRYADDWTGVEENPISLVKNEILIYPNPVRAGSEFYLLFLSVGSCEGEIAVYNALGERMYSDNIFIQEGKNNILMKPAILSSGSYFLVLRKNSGEVMTKPFVVY